MPSGHQDVASVASVLCIGRRGAPPRYRRRSARGAVAVAGGITTLQPGFPDRAPAAAPAAGAPFRRALSYRRCRERRTGGFLVPTGAFFLYGRRVVMPPATATAP